MLEPPLYNIPSIGAPGAETSTIAAAETLGYVGLHVVPGHPIRSKKLENQCFMDQRAFDPGRVRSAICLKIMIIYQVDTGLSIGFAPQFDRHFGFSCGPV